MIGHPEVQEIKLVEEDEMLGPGRRPAPIRYVVDEQGCWQVVNRAHSGPAGAQHPVMSWKGKQVAVARFIWNVVMGRKLDRTDTLKCKCGHQWCVNPDHRTLRPMNDALGE